MNILIIEDDPMVEFIHRNYLEKMNHFEEIHSASSFKDAKAFLAEQTVSLILLDIHLKDGNGIDLLHWIREQQIKSEVIVISATTQKSILQQSMHLGIIDYLIKPFTFDRFRQSIDLYLHRNQKFQNETIDQKEIDQQFHSVSLSMQEDKPHNELEINEKGITKDTYERIMSIIRDLPQPFTIQDVVDNSDLSHVSIRKYISYLEREEHITSEMVYVKVGRPYRVFRYKK